MPPKPRFPDFFEREDELQEYGETAARFPNACPNTVQRFTARKWHQHRSAGKRVPDPQLTKEQLIDAAGWDILSEQTGGEDQMILSQDLKQAIDQACEVFPRPIVLAACELLTVEEASIVCHQRKSDVCNRVGKAKELLRGLLADYNSEN